MIATDTASVARSFLASEENFAIVRDLQRKNLVVPVVGNFAGTKAIRAIGAYLKTHGAIVGAFYVSNVEQYLLREGMFEASAPTSRRCRSTRAARSSAASGAGSAGAARGERAASAQLHVAAAQHPRRDDELRS